MGGLLTDGYLEKLGMTTVFSGTAYCMFVMLVMIVSQVMGLYDIWAFNQLPRYIYSAHGF